MGPGSPLKAVSLLFFVTGGRKGLREDFAQFTEKESSYGG